MPLPAFTYTSTRGGGDARGWAGERPLAGSTSAERPHATNAHTHTMVHDIRDDALMYTRTCIVQLMSLYLSSQRIYVYVDTPA